MAITKVAPQPIRQSAGAAAVALAASGALDIPDGTTTGIPCHIGDAQTATLVVDYTSGSATSAPECLVYGSFDGTKPTDVATLNAHWRPVCLVNDSSALAETIASTGGSPKVVGYGVTVEPRGHKLPAPGAATTQGYLVPIDVRDYPYITVLCREYGDTANPGSVRVQIAFQV